MRINESCSTSSTLHNTSVELWMKCAGLRTENSFVRETVA